MVYAEKFVEMPDGTKIYYRDYNMASKKDPIICLPGLTLNSKSFHDFAIRRMKNFEDRIIAIDMCGRGRSDYSLDDPSRYDLMREVGDIMHILIMEEEIDGAHFVGTSRGGMQAGIIAGMRADKVKSVILNDIACRIPMTAMESISGLFTESAGEYNSYEDALKAFYAHDNGQTKNLSTYEEQRVIFNKYNIIDGKYIGAYDKKGMGEAFKNNIKGLQALNPDFADLSLLIKNLAKIPTLLIHGENSDLVTDDIAKDTLEMLEFGTYVKIKDRGHVPHLTEEDTIKAMDKFLP